MKGLLVDRWPYAKVGLAVGLVAVLVLILVPGAGAEHEKYRYKFPCNPGDTCWVT